MDAGGGWASRRRVDHRPVQPGLAGRQELDTHAAIGAGRLARRVDRLQRHLLPRHEQGRIGAGCDIHPQVGCWTGRRRLLAPALDLASQPAVGIEGGHGIGAGHDAQIDRHRGILGGERFGQRYAQRFQLPMSQRMRRAAVERNAGHGETPLPARLQAHGLQRPLGPWVRQSIQPVDHPGLPRSEAQAPLISTPGTCRIGPFPGARLPLRVWTGGEGPLAPVHVRFVDLEAAADGLAVLAAVGVDQHVVSQRFTRPGDVAGRVVSGLCLAGRIMGLIAEMGENEIGYAAGIGCKRHSKGIADLRQQPARLLGRAESERHAPQSLLSGGQRVQPLANGRMPTLRLAPDVELR